MAAPPTVVVFPLGVNARVDPLSSTGMVAVLVPAVTVTLAVLLLKSADPFCNVTVAVPLVPVVVVAFVKNPLSVLNATVTPESAWFVAFTTVAVIVADDEPSVAIAVSDVPNETPPTTTVGVVTGGVTGVVVVVVPTVPPPPPQAATNATTTNGNNKRKFGFICVAPGKLAGITCGLAVSFVQLSSIRFAA
jgi:hypothetical protein